MDKHESNLSAAKILQAIRDGAANDFSSLDKMFAACAADRHSIRELLERLQALDAITFSDGRYAVTETWMKLQGLLRISLTTLAETKRSLTVNPYFGLPRNLANPPDLFVLMSFSSKLKPVYDDHIVKVATSLGLSVKRADDFFTSHAVSDDIWAGICGSRAVIADCTERNANVFYEIGLAHTVGKPVVLITQAAEDVPFDLKAIRYIEYAYTPPGMHAFEEKLRKTLQAVIEQPAGMKPTDYDGFPPSPALSPDFEGEIALNNAVRIPTGSSAPAVPSFRDTAELLSFVQNVARNLGIEVKSVEPVYTRMPPPPEEPHVVRVRTRDGRTLVARTPKDLPVNVVNGLIAADLEQELDRNGESEQADLG